MVNNINFIGRMDQLDELDLEEITKIISNGCASGLINNEEKHIYFELRFNVWKDE